jgi:DNA polymerase-4
MTAPRAKTIFHVDLDSFFVSAERLRNPALVGKCVAVGGSANRGVISSASYEARRFGVRSAMPVAHALRICPGLILLKSDFEWYGELSRKVFDILGRYTPILEQVSIDEGYLDMSGTRLLWGEPIEAARQIKAAVLKETGLVCSIGIAANRLVAKVGTDHGKPDGLVYVPPGTEPEFLAPMSVRKIPGVGPATSDWLEARGLALVRDLQFFPEDALERRWGRYGSWLWRAAQGQGSTEFHEPSKTRSISREMTFSENLQDREKCLESLWEICRSVGGDLRKEGAWARAVRVKFRYSDFETPTRSRTLEYPVCTDDELYRVAQQLFDKSWDSERSLRLIGAGAVVGAPGDGGQGPVRQWGLFENPQLELKREGLDQLRDRLREKFGEKSVISVRPQLE